MAKYCAECGRKLGDDAKFCDGCGKPQDDFYISKVRVSKDFLTDVDFRDDIRDVVLSNARLTGVTVNSGAKISAKQMKNAIQYCGNEFGVSDVIAICDETLFNTLDTGTVFTTVGIYRISSKRVSKKMKYEKVKSIKGEDSGGILSNGKKNCIVIQMLNGNDVQWYAGGSPFYPFDGMWKLFKNVCVCINQYRDDYPIEIIE